ncbi:PREDICTED: 17-beta-hydroxysteroid dehydrogenase 14-like [Papilio polytes]|uniref:17-beta-hydroxysteroid dehydrogenase 14-like n=1 Tax=Papilio polytes TaxID=76194 RepID=UPI0006763924|nr:PREDICTED: 17-beta-hydroxysteroid dehydrogenase 14-like [Papilio polytes]
MSFDNKVVIVTGSSSGIGAGTALAFAKEGASVVIVGRNEEKMKNVSTKCESLGKKPLVVKADVSNDADAKRIIDETIKTFGKLDILVNNAGMAEQTEITSDDFMESFDRVMNINLRAAVYITHLAIPHLIKTKGNIVNISSIAGTSTTGTAALVSYCTSKAGLNHFSRGVALKLAEHGVRVNIISPGPVRTDILDNLSIPNFNWDHFKATTPLKRYSEPEEIADLILFLASDKARGITGSDFVSDNGLLLKQ